MREKRLLSFLLSVSFILMIFLLEGCAIKNNKNPETTNTTLETASKSSVPTDETEQVNNNVEKQVMYFNLNVNVNGFNYTPEFTVEIRDNKNNNLLSTAKINKSNYIDNECKFLCSVPKHKEGDKFRLIVTSKNPKIKKVIFGGEYIDPKTGETLKNVKEYDGYQELLINKGTTGSIIYGSEKYCIRGNIVLDCSELGFLVLDKNNKPVVGKAFQLGCSKEVRKKAVTDSDGIAWIKLADKEGDFVYGIESLEPNLKVVPENTKHEAKLVKVKAGEAKISKEQDFRLILYTAKVVDK